MIKSPLLAVLAASLSLLASNSAHAETVSVPAASEGAEAVATCPAINAEKELFITDLNVVNDRRAEWKFKTLISNMVNVKLVSTPPTDEQLDAFVRRFFEAWRKDTIVNGFKARKRNIKSEAAPGRVDAFLEAWPKIKNKKNVLDLDKAPVRLLAIAYRPDLKKTDTAGEARFIFGLLDSAGNPQPSTIIFEYHLPIRGANGIEQNSRFWAESWHALGSVSEEVYKQKLASVTQLFTKRGAMPSGINGNAISQVRTNEIFFASPWELREFVLSTDPRTGDGFLKQTTVKQTPDRSFFDKGNSQNHLVSWMNTNKTAILDNTFTLPASLSATGNFQQRPLLGAAAPTSGFGEDQWLSKTTAPQGVSLSDWKKMIENFSEATCSGCHGSRAKFLHVFPRRANKPSNISQFVRDDLIARKKFMEDDLGCVVPKVSAESRAHRVH